LSQRLTLLQQSLESQHQRELEVVKSSNRNTLVVAAVLTGTALLAMSCLAFFVLRATNRLTAMALSVPLDHALDTGQPRHALTAGDAHFAAANPAELAGARFLGALEQLERRLRELEHTAPQPQLTGADHQLDAHPEYETGKSATNPDAIKVPDEPESSPTSGSAAGLASRARLLLAKGQTLLTLDKPAEAIVCFDEVIALDSQNAEALLKKGSALERLRRMEEALDFYDRALAADSTLTTAYLYKGGVFNHLQRYEEALKCYEQALQSEQRALAS
jgi:tetratricopeptide (TPR) repeat protein